MRFKSAFTLIEVLISIVLMGIILPALYKTVGLLQDSNSHLYSYLMQSKKESLAIQTLFLDIVSSDGNLTLKNGEFDRLCLEKTRNSLYGLSEAKVCWVVLKQNNTLVRAEGSEYHLPIGFEERVEIDSVMSNLALFDLYWSNDRVVVVLQKEKQEPVTFMVQGITKPKPKKKKKKKRSKKTQKTSTSDNNQTRLPKTNKQPSPPFSSR